MDLKKFAGVTAYYRTADGAELGHEQYYALLIEQLGGLARIIQYILFSLQKLKEAVKEDPNFNNLPLSIWDRAAGFNTRGGRCDLVGSRLTSLYRAYGIHTFSCSEGVSLLKEAAREWVSAAGENLQGGAI